MKVFEQQPIFNKTVLNNGVRIVTEHHPNTRATSAGIYVESGTRDEPEDMIGAAHFIEHLVFKGTKKRTAYEIAASLEAVGGDLNAYTTREYTCFHGTSLKEHLNLSLDVLIDLINQAQFTADEFERERQVVLQEIDMSADALEEYIFDLYFEEAYKGHPLGRPILGTEESLAGISRAQIMDFYNRRYRGRRLIVSVAGSVDHDEVVKLVTQGLARKKDTSPEQKRTKPKMKKFRRFVPRSSEQAHILLGFPSSNFRDETRFEAYIVNALLGGGMTSRLYQEVREKLGLVYSIYSYLHSFVDSGSLMLYAGTSKAYLAKVAYLMVKELNHLRDKGVSEKALKMFKTQVKGNILLGADDIENRMNSLAVNEMVFGRYRPVDEIIEEIDQVSKDSVRKYLDNYLDPKDLGVLLLGDIGNESDTVQAVLEAGS